MSVDVAVAVKETIQVEVQAQRPEHHVQDRAPRPRRGRREHGEEQRRRRQHPVDPRRVRRRAARELGQPQGQVAVRDVAAPRAEDRAHVVRVAHHGGVGDERAAPRRRAEKREGRDERDAGVSRPTIARLELCVEPMAEPTTRAMKKARRARLKKKTGIRKMKYQQRQ